MDLHGVPPLRYMTLATVSLVTYEYLINLDYEVRYLWKRRLSYGGVLLALCRYLPFTGAFQIYLLFSTNGSTPCLAGYRALACFIFAELLLSVLVLFTRTYAVWGRTTRIFIILGLIYAGATAGSSYAMITFLRGLSEPNDIVLRHCQLTLINEDMWIVVVILVCCESLALGLLLIKSVQHANEMRIFTAGRSTKNLLAVMARDGIGYFICTLVITTANMIVIAHVATDLRDMLFVTQGALQDILCSRLLFHVQVVNEFPNGSVTTYSQHSQNSLSFSRTQMDPSTAEVELPIIPRRRFDSNA